MKTKSRILAILTVLVLLVMAVLTAVLPALADEPEVTEVGTWNDLLNAVNSDKTYIKLLTHIVDDVPDDELPTKHRLVFDGGKDYVLDLGGFTLRVCNRVNEFYTDKFSMIGVSGDSNLEIRNGSIGFENYYASNRVNNGVVSVADTSTLVAKNVSMRNHQTGTVIHASNSAEVTLAGGEYTVQNGFALYMTGQAALTLDDGVYIHTTMGDSADTVFIAGYGSLYSNSTGALNINYATFKSGIQIGSTQTNAFSIATHEILINGEKLTEEIFDGTNYEAKQEGKLYYWYDWTTKALKKAEDSSFCNTVSVISYEKKYPIDIQDGTATVGGLPVTEASYGQEVTITADAPEAGMTFVRWGTSGVELLDHYSASTTFTMTPTPVTLAAYYGNIPLNTVDLSVTAPKVGETPTFTATSTLETATASTVEWFIVGQGATLDETDIFYPGVAYGVRILVHPSSDYQFADTVTPTVNGQNATINNGSAAYQVVEYRFAALPANLFHVYYKENPQLGVGGKLELDIDTIKGASDSFKDALDAEKVTYQWYRNGKPIEGATESEYAFIPDDIGCKIFARITADGTIAYGENFTCTGGLFHVYFNMSEAKVGRHLPQITSATPGVYVASDTLTFFEKLGENSYSDALDIAKAVLLPGKTYRVVAFYGVSDPEITVGNNASFYLNEAEATKDGSRLIYEFTMPAADFAVSATSTDEIGIGAELVATEITGATYQWYRNGEPIEDATDRTYLVTKADKDSLLHCVVTIADGTSSFTEQISIGSAITVLRFEVTAPQNNTTKSAIIKSVSIGSFTNMTGWMPGTIANSGDFMGNSDTFVEGNSYVGYFQVQAPEGLYFVNSSTQTKAYCNGTSVGEFGGFDASSQKITFLFQFTAVHKHEYDDNVWAYDEYGCWHPCTVSGCPNPHEEWIEYTDHTGGTATCQTKGECAKCGQLYLGYHDFSVPDYQYVNDMICANFCEHCDLYADWSYHQGGTFDCTHKAVCEICHKEYGKLDEHKPVSEWSSDTNTHWHKCSVCGGEKLAEGAHADSDTNGKCDVCGADVPVPPPAHTHDHGTAWKTDEGEHWNECACGDKANKASHADPNNDGKCDTCEYQMTSGGGNTETPDNPDNTPDIPNEDKGGLGTGAIVGIAVGSVAVVGLGGFSLFWFVIKKKSFADLLLVFKK